MEGNLLICSEHPVWIDSVKMGVSRSEFWYEANEALKKRSGKGFCHAIRKQLE